MYKITIEKITKEEVTTSEWKRISDEKWRDTDGQTREGRYGYIEGKQTKTTEEVLYEQKAENINLISIINAFNSIKEIS